MMSWQQSWRPPVSRPWPPGGSTLGTAWTSGLPSAPRAPSCPTTSNPSSWREPTTPPQVRDSCCVWVELFGNDAFRFTSGFLSWSKQLTNVSVYWLSSFMCVSASMYSSTYFLLLVVTILMYSILYYPSFLVYFCWLFYLFSTLYSFFSIISCGWFSPFFYCCQCALPTNPSVHVLYYCAQTQMMTFAAPPVVRGENYQLHLLRMMTSVSYLPYIT